MIITLFEKFIHCSNILVVAVFSVGNDTKPIFLRVRYIFARNIFNLLLDKHNIALNVDINVHIIQYKTFKVFKSLNQPQTVIWRHFRHICYQVAIISYISVAAIL